MELEAKINSREVKYKFWFFEWDRSKYRIVEKRVRMVAMVLFAFFLGYTLVTVMNQEDVKTQKAVASTFTILPVQQVSAAPEPITKAETSGKRPVVERPVYSGPQVISREIAGIPPGTLTTARLITGASDGPVRAKLLQNIAAQGEILLEAGGVLIGQGTSSEDRLFIKFDRMVKKDGSVLQIQAQAIDRDDRIAGLRGSRVGNELAKLGAGIGLNFIGGLSEGLQDMDVKNGIGVKNNSLKNAMLNGAAYAALDQSKELMSSYKDKTPRIEVEKGKVILTMTE